MWKTYQTSLHGFLWKEYCVLFARMEQWISIWGDWIQSLVWNLHPLYLSGCRIYSFADLIVENSVKSKLFPKLYLKTGWFISVNRKVKHLTLIDVNNIYKNMFKNYIVGNSKWRPPQWGNKLIRKDMRMKGETEEKCAQFYQGCNLSWDHSHGPW